MLPCWHNNEEFLLEATLPYSIMAHVKWCGIVQARDNSHQLYSHILKSYQKTIPVGINCRVVHHTVDLLGNNSQRSGLRRCQNYESQLKKQPLFSPQQQAKHPHHVFMSHLFFFFHPSKLE